MIATEMEGAIGSLHLDGVHWVSKFTQVIHIAVEWPASHQESARTRIKHRTVNSGLPVGVLKDDMATFSWKLRDCHAFSGVLLLWTGGL